MDGTAESDIAQYDNKTLDANTVCVDNNDQINIDTNAKCPVLVTNELSPKNDTVDTVACGKPEDEQLFDLMVLDDDSLNQLQVAPELKIEHISEYDMSVKSEPVINSEDPSKMLSKEGIQLEEKIAVTEKIDSSQDNDQIKNEFIKPIAKAPESDSLILTADDELETEMFLSEKEKNEKSDKDDDAVSIGLAPENFKKTESEQNAEKDKIVISTDSSCSNLNGTDKKATVVEHVTCKNESKNVHVFGSRFLWVSNITHSIKATELKQFISKIGKVITAKIVTDGKKCYGYVVMDNFQDANECLKILNNTMFEGRKITVSFTRPATSNGDKKESSTTIDNDKNKNKLNNETDDTKFSKSKDRRCITSTPRKTRESSKTRSSSVRKRRSRDPLTTKFESKDRFCRGRKSHSGERCSTDFLRDKLERDRLRRRILEEQRRSRDEMIREMHREEKQRELEFRLERERRKLQFERELFERERRELYRLDAERRKIEKERLEVMQERTKLEKEYQKNRSTRKSDEFNLSSTIVKPQVALKGFEKSKPKGLGGDSNFRKLENKHDRNSSNDSKNAGPLAHRIGLKDDFKLGKENRERSKSRRGEDLKNYERSIPPPPNLSNDFDLSTGRKLKHQDFKRDVHGDRKIDHGGRKIEVIDRKYYPDRSHENPERKNENVYRKADFDDRKTCSFPERKYEYGRDAKRSRVGEFPGREPTLRNQWLPTTNYTEPWKTGITAGITNSPLRYPDGNFSSASYGGTNRMSPVYYHSGPSTQDYQRYDHCSQNNGRKY